MSGEASARKKKDRRRKKANIEQLQREEHQEERSRILHIEDDDDDVVFRPSRAQRQEDEETLLESQPKGGSGWCVRLVFLVLLGAVGLAVGVVFLEIDANKDLSSIVADSTAKVSSVLQDTGDAVSSLWNEHGSTVSEIFETVKQSIGLEGTPSEQKAPLEDLADKKEYVEETAQAPVEESEEFFDEGEETGLPVEVPAGDVVPEPVKPADTYEEPEVAPAAEPEEVVEEPVVSQEAKEEEAAIPIAQEVEEPVAEDVAEEEVKIEQAAVEVESVSGQIEETVHQDDVLENVEAEIVEDVIQDVAPEPAVDVSAKPAAEEQIEINEEETHDQSPQTSEQVVSEKRTEINQETVQANSKAAEQDDILQTVAEKIITEDALHQEAAEDMEDAGSEAEVQTEVETADAYAETVAEQDENIPAPQEPVQIAESLVNLKQKEQTENIPAEDFVSEAKIVSVAEALPVQSALKDDTQEQMDLSVEGSKGELLTGVPAQEDASTRVAVEGKEEVGSEAEAETKVEAAVASNASTGNMLEEDETISFLQEVVHEVEPVVNQETSGVENKEQTEHIPEEGFLSKEKIESVLEILPVQDVLKENIQEDDSSNPLTEELIVEKQEEIIVETKEAVSGTQKEELEAVHQSSDQEDLAYESVEEVVQHSAEKIENLEFVSETLPVPNVLKDNVQEQEDGSSNPVTQELVVEKQGETFVETNEAVLETHEKEMEAVDQTSDQQVLADESVQGVVQHSADEMENLSKKEVVGESAEETAETHEAKDVPELAEQANLATQDEIAVPPEYTSETPDESQASEEVEMEREDSIEQADAVQEARLELSEVRVIEAPIEEQAQQDFSNQYVEQASEVLREMEREDSIEQADAVQEARLELSEVRVIEAPIEEQVQQDFSNQYVEQASEVLREVAETSAPLPEQEDEAFIDGPEAEEPIIVAEHAFAMERLDEEVEQSQEEEVVPEIVEDAPEDFVSTPVEIPEEAQSVPQELEEVVPEIVEDAPDDVVSTPVENPEEAQSVPEDSQEVEEAAPEVFEDVPENVVSTPVEAPEEAQSVPEGSRRTEEQEQEEQEEIVEDAVSAPADSSLEAEAEPEESQEDVQEELVENVVSTPVDSPLEAQSVPEEVLDTHNLVEEVVEALEEPTSEEQADQPEPEVETTPVESQEEIVEDVVSVPVDAPEEAQSVPEEVLQTHDVVEEVAEAADASVEEEVEPEDEVPVQESAEEPVPEVRYDAPDEMVSAPAVEEPEQAQSVPQAVVEEKQEPANTVYADSYGEPAKDTVSEATSAENEISQEEIDEEEETVDPEKVAYSKIDITNDADWEIREELDLAEEAISKSALEALAKFEDLLRAHPDSPRALYGRAMALDKLADRERSNSRLEQTIFAYRNVLDQEHAVPDALYRLAGTRVVERMKFRGFQGKAIRTQQRLILRFPDDLSLRNELAVIYLTVGHNDAAKELLQDILKQWPNSGFAKVHYGFILKNIDQNMEEGARYLQEGIDSDEEGALDGRFFYHLGDAYERLGRRADAERIYEEGEKLGLFRSKHQRSLYNVDRLQSKPFWTKEETTYEDFLTKLEENWETIRDEGLALMNLTPPEGFKDEAESLRDTGDWKQFELFARGRKLPGCAKAPKTCALLESFPPASTCKRGQSKFSIMHPGTHVWAHTGPTNCRLRSHLGLKVPEGVMIRVVNETRSWEEGKVFVFDDSFDHEVWHNGSSFRLVLIVDLWHPDLTESERQTLPAI